MVYMRHRRYRIFLYRPGENVFRFSFFLRGNNGKRGYNLETKRLMETVGVTRWGNAVTILLLKDLRNFSPLKFSTLMTYVNGHCTWEVQSMERRYKFVGPPGVGKTTTLAGSASLNSGKYGAESVVCCSLTRAAAAVLAERVAVPEKNIGTLHALAFRALGLAKDSLTAGKEKDFNQHNPSWALSSGYGSIDAPSDEMRQGKTIGDLARERMDILRARRIHRNDTDWSACADFAIAWDTWKRDAGLVDFTDLLETCLADVSECPGSPAVIIVDEAQDIPQLGIDLLLKWGSATQKIIFAGDANQNLYSWAGADAGAFINIVTDPLHRKVIDQSWRVPRAVHQIATRIEGWLTEREVAEWKPRDCAGGVDRFNDTCHSPHAVIGRAAKLASDGQTVMILASCSHMLNNVVALLHRAGVPFHNSYRSWRLDWNPLQAARKGKPTTLDRLMAFLRPCLSGNGEPGRWNKHDLSLWMEMLKAENVFIHGGKKMLTALRGDDAMPTFDDFAAMLTTPGMATLDEWELAAANNVAPILKALRERCLPDWQKKLDYLLRIAENHGVDALQETPKITVGTVHSVKGGQAQHVFLFPELSGAAFGEWNSGARGRDAILRMLYVGATRASETLTICGYKWRGVEL